MKKIIALFLVVIVCLTFSACGDEGNTTKGENVLHLNEKTTIGDFELTITDLRILETFKVNDTLYGSKNSDECQLLVFYTLKNVGKEEITALPKIFTVEYSDGYTFESNRYFHTKASPDILTYGGTNEGIVDLEVLGNEVYFMEVYSLPNAVRDSKDEPLKLRLNSKLFGVEEYKAVYNIRPIDDTQKEALYQYAVSLQGEGKYKQAMTNLEEISGYKDSATIYEECKKNWAIRYGVVDDAKEYFITNIDKFSEVTGDELSNIMVGKWQLSKGSNPWQFLADGTINDGHGNDRWWSVSGNNLILKTDKLTDTLCVKKVCDNGYLLISADGSLYSTMYIAE